VSEKALRNFRGLKRVLDTPPEFSDTTSRPNREYSGTNVILHDLGMPNHDTNEYVGFYGKGIAKVTSRIAYDHSRRTGLSLDFRYLFEAVDRLGAKTVRDFLNKSIELENILTNYDIRNFNGFRIVTPIESKTPLEVITSGPSIPKNVRLVSESLKPLGLSLKYAGPEAVLFDY